jgi:hypothetical protein
MVTVPRRLFQNPQPGIGVSRRAEEDRKMPMLSDFAKGNRAFNAIRAKYRTPEAVLARLGIDQSLLEEEPKMGTASEVLAMIDKAMKSLSPEEQSALCEGMYTMLEDTDSVRDPSAGQDARRRRFASDAKLTSADRARRSFNQRFPNAARIGSGWS